MQLYDFLSEKLSLTRQEISAFAFSAPKKYKIYTIPKRTTGRRVIAHPSRRLKLFQRLLILKLEKQLKIHPAATAYRKGMGIKDNALIHVNGRYLLKMDLREFFPSITPDLFFKVMESEGVSFERDDRYLIKTLLFCNMSKKNGAMLRLSIGAPSSPFLSNVIMFGFDTALKEYAKKMGVQYTRYADDLTFSTNVKDVLFDFPNVVQLILKQHLLGFVSVNHAKTVFASKAHNRHVTGITITNKNGLSIGRSRKRLISSLIHKFSVGDLDSEDTSYLRGLLAFASDIEPDFLDRMRCKYSEAVLDSIFKG